MPSAFLLAPFVLPTAAAALIAALGLAGIDVGRAIAALAVWASVASLLVLWVPLRATQELIFGPLGYGSSVDIRVDAVAFAFGLLIAAPAAVMLTLQRRTWRESALATLCIAAAITAVESGGLVLASIAGGTAAMLAVVLLQAENPRAPRPRWAVLLAAWLGLAWLGVLLQVRGGTAVYAAVPVSIVTPAVFVLLVFVALLASGLLAWRAWPAQLWSRPSLAAAGIALSALYPLGFYLLVRGYELGGGRYPHPAFNVLLGVLGVITAFAAAARAQAAPTRHDYFGQVGSVAGGFALMSIAVGTPLGLIAGLGTLAGAAALSASLSLLSERTRVASLITIAAAAGLPPGLLFGSIALGIESNFERGNLVGLIGVAGMGTWALWMVASARAVGLPARATRQDAQRSNQVALGIALLVVLSGPALAVLLFSFANPVALEVMQGAPGSLATRLASVVTTSSVLPVLTLLLPLLVIAVVAYAATGVAGIRTQPRPAVLVLSAPRLLTRTLELASAARVPDQYRSLLNLPRLEAAASGGRPWLWIGAMAALAFAVTR